MIDDWKPIAFLHFETRKIKTTVWLISKVSKNQTINVIARFILEYNREYFYKPRVKQPLKNTK